MGTQLAVANPTYLPPSPEILDPEASPVLEYHNELQFAARVYRVTTMRIAFYGHRMRMSEGWTALGYESGPRGEEQYRESLQVPRSSWYRALRIGQAFHQLSLRELEALPIGNAEILLSVNPLILHDYDWVQEARTKPKEELTQLVIARNRAVGDTREPLSAMVFRVPLLARKAIDHMLEAFQRKYELSSKSQAIEMIVAEKHNRPNLLAATQQARKLIGGAVASLRQQKGCQSEDAVEWLTLAMEVLDEAYQAEVEATRKAADLGAQAGGRA